MCNAPALLGPYLRQLGPAVRHTAAPHLPAYMAGVGALVWTEGEGELVLIAGS